MYREEHDGMDFGNLSAFQRDLLIVIAGERHSGLEIKRVLDADRYERINHGRLYSNLNGLVDDGLVNKGSRDARTNEYRLTDDGRAALDEQLEWYEKQLD